VFSAFPGNQTQKCDDPFARYPVGECSRKPARPGLTVARGRLWYTHILVSRARKVSYTISHVQAIPDPGLDIVQVWVTRRTIPDYIGGIRTASCPTDPDNWLAPLLMVLSGPSQAKPVPMYNTGAWHQKCSQAYSSCLVCVKQTRSKIS
jgi:hypothetical protein